MPIRVYYLWMKCQRILSKVGSLGLSGIEYRG
jgi:hypothetical protein